MEASHSKQVVINAVGLAMASTISIGFARFAYALLLPDMQADLGWSYTFSGAMNTANAVGYLLGAMSAPAVGRKVGEHRAFLFSLLVTASAVLITGFMRANWVLLSFRMAAGIAGATAFIMGAVLAVRLAATTDGKVSGFVFAAYSAGCGLGVALSGALIPLVLSKSGWQAGWIALGVTSLLLTVPAWLSSRVVRLTAGMRTQERTWPTNGMTPALWAYFLFAFGYIGYMTFSVALLRSQGHSPGEITTFWIVLGVAAVLAPWVWSGPIAMWRGGKTLFTLLLASAIGSALPLIFPTAMGAYASAILFGGSFLTVVAMMSALVRRIAAPNRWNAGVAMFTVIFAVGQILGPVVAGLISDTSAGLASGLGFSSGVLLIGAVVGLAQREQGEWRQPGSGRSTTASFCPPSPSPS